MMLIKQYFLLIGSIALAYYSLGQDKAVRDVTLALKKSDVIYNSVGSDAVFSLNNSTQELVLGSTCSRSFLIQTLKTH